jgi:DNA topoisomerase-1
VSIPVIAVDPVQAARKAGLRYVSDTMPGIRRTPRGSSWEYRLPDGSPLRDAEEIQRIHHLAIPPAWTDVWISPIPNGHLQATGRDARGRKQYRYHDQWRAVRDQAKYERMIEFGKALPRVRHQVAVDLRKPGLPREKVLATVVRLLDTTAIRVGNEEYARENNSYGLTTLRRDHACVEGSTILFHFRGKAGKEHAVEVHDKRLARIVQQVQELPGHELFSYIDDDGELRGVSSEHVNEYLHEIAGDEFTAKDFRTWVGTVLAACFLRELGGPVTSEREGRRHVKEAIERVARQLGNTPAIARKCYVHPDVIDAYMDGTLLRLRLHVPTPGRANRTEGLREEERAVLRLLERRKLPSHVTSAVSVGA